ncbi:MAG TPA: uracil phosphoribosyltransferase [Anaerolineales bacterium]|nr:uracil phosphoribosyltransferase [Anaerolineae bacterium]HIP86813.1 uracil phosphoribosyltransferase [Anaerolineales bacterium]
MNAEPRNYKPKTEVTVSELYVSTHPLVQHKLALLRDERTDCRKFRELVREISTLLIYEATRDLHTEPVPVKTPLAETVGRKLAEQVGLVPILRAGLGMVEGAWQMMPGAEVWHIGLSRDEKTLQPVEYYSRLPVSPTVDVCLILDPMLATGGSAVATVEILKRWGARRIKFVGIIGARPGVERMQSTHPDVPIYLAALDEELNEHGFIVPGLGDAGDRMFGTG